MRLAALIIGVLVLVGTATSVFTTLVVPRTTSSRLLRSAARLLAKMVRGGLRLVSSYEVKDRAMAMIGPFTLVLLFAVWLGMLVVGFGLVFWWIDKGPLIRAIEVAGSSVFTLGFANGPHLRTQVLEFVAAAMGLLVIALEIAYLPALYSSFSTREAAVTMLASRAGVPAWGPEILTRHHWFKTMDELPALYTEWEQWSAAVAESHTSYPTLMWFRSPVPTRSWLLALVAMLDAAALQDATCPSTTPRQARLLLAMGSDCLRSLARALAIPFDPDPLPTSGTRLTYQEFVEGIDRLREVDFDMERSLADSWRNFQGWRVNYEGIVDALTPLIMPPPAPWLLARPHLGAARWPQVVDRTPDDPEPASPSSR